MTATGPAPVGEALLSIDGLTVEFSTGHGKVRAVDDLTYEVNAGEIVAIVGESGSGKSVSALTVMGLLPPGTARVPKGRILFAGRDLLALDEEEMRTLRGRDIAMIFQEPMTSLNPVLNIGLQIKEPLLIHMGMSEEEATARAVELLGLVGITDPESRLAQYPHQLSGGMRQRVMIAIGLACNPRLLIADEPTTALDVTIQAQILELLKNLSRQLNIAVIIITHNLGIVARYADRVNVMYAARLIEQGSAVQVFSNPSHPYTRGLLGAVPRLDQPRRSRLATIDGTPPNLLAPPPGCRFAPRCKFRVEACSIVPEAHVVAAGHSSACHRLGELGALKEASTASGGERTLTVRAGDKPVLKVERAVKHFPVSGGLFRAAKMVRAVQDASFEIMAGETLGLVGESGCGKSTLGRLVLRLDDPTDGHIHFEGRDLVSLNRGQMLDVRKRLQVIFQDPYSSLNPRMTVGQIIAEPIRVHKVLPSASITARVRELLQLVGLFPYMADRYPHELSGGQRQRVGIARALGMNPRMIVADEAVSALDVSIQGQVINLLEDLQKQLNLTYLFIAHDLAVVRHISTRIAVMYLGRIVEYGPTTDVFANPRHPYTQALLAAAPIPDPIVERTRPRSIISGELPSPLRPPPGCVFHPRCPKMTEACKSAVPSARQIGPGHDVACIHA